MPERSAVSRRHVLRTGGAALASGLAGCIADSSSDDTPSRASPTAAVDLELPSTGGCPDGAAARLADEPTIASRMADRYPDRYAGPLFLAHEHFYTPLDEGSRVAWEMRGDCLSRYLEFMDRNDVSTVLPFVATHQLPDLQEHGDRFAPFLNDFIFTTYVNQTPVSAWPSLAEQLLANHDGIAGLGEFALFGLEKETGQPAGNPPMDPMRADHPALMDVYAIAAEHDVPVMLHPFLQPPQLGSEYESDPMASPEVQALANAFETHRDTTFLVHGLQPVGEWIASLLEAHPNWYYDVSGLMTPHHWNPDDPRTPPVDFETHMTPEHIRVHAERAFEKWRPIFRRAPRRVVVGFDMGQTWSLDAHVLDSWVETFRSVLGYLPEETATRIAHRNAERMIAGG